MAGAAQAAGRLLRAALLPALLVSGGCKLARERDPAEDRAEIHALLVQYGATLDARDFDGFAGLFAKDGVYVAGTGKGVTGPEAGAMMREVFARNAMGIRQPAYHVFFNETIALDDANHAHAGSMSFYVAPDEKGHPAPVMMARYRDTLVRENGAWKFARREVESLIPAPPRAN